MSNKKDKRAETSAANGALGGRPRTLAQPTNINFRCDAEELKSWKRAAAQARVKLSLWLRVTANKACQQNADTNSK